MMKLFRLTETFWWCPVKYFACTCVCVFVFSVISDSVFHHEVRTVSTAQGHRGRVGNCVLTLTWIQSNR